MFYSFASLSAVKSFFLLLPVDDMKHFVYYVFVCMGKNGSHVIKKKRSDWLKYDFTDWKVPSAQRSIVFCTFVLVRRFSAFFVCIELCICMYRQTISM